MEAIEEPPLLNTPVDGMKVTVLFDETDENAVASVATDVCQKSNGVAESSESTEVSTAQTSSLINENKTENEISAAVIVKESKDVDKETNVPSTDVADTTKLSIGSADEQTKISIDASSPIVTTTLEGVGEDREKSIGSDDIGMAEPSVEVDNIVEASMERVTFQTEILVESNDNEVIESVTEETTIIEQDTNNLLSELGQSIELSEALRSSDVTDNIENNNCAARQEVFNKEELLDILEGNDAEQPENVVPVKFQNMCSEKILEAQLALQQLSRLKSKPKKPRKLERLPRSRKCTKEIIIIKQEHPLNQSVTENVKKEVKHCPQDQSATEDGKKVVKHSRPQDQSSSTEAKNDDNIINVLVKEWDDEEASEVEKSNKILEESENLLKSSHEIMQIEEAVTKEEEAFARTSIDSTTEGTSSVLNKSSDESQPQRRLGRVIKKKVIFDPDNPDTFTKCKTIMKTKEPGVEKEQTPSKKSKTDQTFQRSKSKSPMSKLQWKKPSPKICKQNKRLTEVDKLLMDEGAVNMIYQLTPEAPKGKKNMKTKAEFIKKIQSSTPDSKEMKFRERKKESKYEEGEARKILGGKQRSSLSSSVKSPSVCEDFEAHSADDSIIYRRHSSSSYSSSCMSPRRLSDVEASSQGVARNHQQAADGQSQPNTDGNSNRPISDVFMSESTGVMRADIINKDDCLSIKEKLNSKLNLALNKRKCENSKTEKPSKQKKVMKSDEKTNTSIEDFKYLSINFDQRLAEICVQKAGLKCNMEVIKELEKVLILIESRKDISVTLLTPECGLMYSDLDLKPLLDDDMEKTTNFAYEMAESIRSLLRTVERHTKLLCSGLTGRCSGIGLALIGLSDMALASERASIAISAKSHAPLALIEPGVSVFTTYKLLPQPLLNDLVVFGRRLTASEALQGGLVSRTLWPENFNDQVYTIAKDIASQPAQNIWLKKQLLNIKKCGSESTFLSHLEKERDLLVEYWTSVEGQEILRAKYNTA